MRPPIKNLFNPSIATVPAWIAGLGLSLALALNVNGQAHTTNAAAELSLKKLQVAPGLKVELFAAEPMLENPVSFSIDEHGRFFIAESHRWARSVFDITKELPWLLNDLSFRTVPDRTAFLSRQGRGRPREAGLSS